MQPVTIVGIRISELITLGVLRKTPGGGRSTAYELVGDFGIAGAGDGLAGGSVSGEAGVQIVAAGW